MKKLLLLTVCMPLMVFGAGASMDESASQTIPTAKTIIRLETKEAVVAYMRETSTEAAFPMEYTKIQALETEYLFLQFMENRPYEEQWAVFSSAEGGLAKRKIDVLKAMKEIYFRING